MARYHDPDRLLGAANFSSDERLRGSLNAVKLVKSQPWVWDSLRTTCELEKKYARKRHEGHWELVAVAFIASRQVDIQPFHDGSTPELWRACGFAEKQTYSTTWRRLRELETVCEAFLDAAALVIRRCREHDSRVMAHTHIDATENETHAALVHDCQKGESCAYAKAGQVWSHSYRPGRISSAIARESRQEMSAQAPDITETLEKQLAPEKVKFEIRDGRKIKRIRKKGCWYRTRDLDAGIRSYTTPGGRSRKWWTGYYSTKLVDHFTGGIVPSVDSASKQEHLIFPEIFDRATEMIGAAPETIVGDRGYSIASCFEHATRAGTASVFPWRAHRGKTGRQRKDCEEYDRHGVKRCAHCGGPMKQTRFSAKGGYPRLWFSCTLQSTNECAKEQTISCSKDWRTLIPLARTEPLYQELRASHQSYEAVHDYFRDRYRVAGDTLANRPKVVSIGCHRLRANAACLLDWLKIAAKNGWLGSTRSSKRHPGSRKFKTRGEKAAEDLKKHRTRLGLSAPYGFMAKVLGLGDELPPSKQPPPAKPDPPPSA